MLITSHSTLIRSSSKNQSRPAVAEAQNFGDSVTFGNVTKDAGLISPSLVISTPQKRLVQAVRGIRKRHGVPTLGALMTKGGKTFSYTEGVREAGTDNTTQPKDKFHLGSCTKMMTATMLARLVENKEISWDTTVGYVFSKENIEVHEALRDVTLAELTSHESGLPENFESLPLDLAIGMLDGTATRLQLAKEVLPKAPTRERGRYAYSNLGYIVAGTMAEIETGKSWEVLMNEEVFGPLEMHSAGFGPTGPDQPRGHFVNGEPAHSSWKEWRDSDHKTPIPDNVEVFGPAGTVHCSQEDWLKFILCQMNRSSDYLNEKNWALLQTDRGQGYTQGGWAVGPSGLEHDGTNTSNYCYVTLTKPENGEPAEATLVVTNQGGPKGLSAIRDMTQYLRSEIQKN